MREVMLFVLPGDLLNCLLDGDYVHFLENAYFVAMDVRVVLEHLAESALLDQSLESIEFMLALDMLEELYWAVDLLATWAFPGQRRHDLLIKLLRLHIFILFILCFILITNTLKGRNSKQLMSSLNSFFFQILLLDCKRVVVIEFYLYCAIELHESKVNSMLIRA